MLTLTPTLRVWLYATLVCLTGCLFGGDTGSIGSITVMDQFVEHFGELSEFMRGFVVSVILLPSAVTGLVAGKLMDKISRKYTISLGAVIFAVGSGISCGAPNLAVLIVARCIAGAGEGLFLSASTCYLCEIAPRHLRGRVMSCFQLFISGALALGYFTCYGTVKMQSSFAWRTTFAMSTVVALFCAICTPYLPYSPRWLMSKGRRAEAEEVLNLVTGPEDEAERKELLAVPPADDVGWSHIFEKGVRGRTLLGTFLNVFQMTTGIDFVLFYSPTLFVQAGLDAATSSFIASGVTGIVVFLGTAVGTLFVDRAGRRPMIIGGGIAMTAALLLMGALYASKGAETKGGKWVVILLIEVFAATFAGTWALLVRLYASEIQPYKTRAAASSFGQGANQLTNTIVALTSPAFLAKSGYGPYFLYGSCTLIGTVISYLFMPETRGKSLENIDTSFSTSPVSVSWPSILRPQNLDTLRNRRRSSRRRSSAHKDGDGRPTFPAHMGMERLGSSALMGSAIDEE